MGFTVGGTDVAKVYLGSSPVDAVYLGAKKVWPTAAPPVVQALLDVGAVVVWYDNKEWADGATWTLSSGTMLAAGDKFGSVPLWHPPANNDTLSRPSPATIPPPWTAIGITKESYISAEPWLAIAEHARLAWSPYNRHDRSAWTGTAWGAAQGVQVGWGGYDTMMRAWVAQADGQERFHAIMPGHALHTGTLPSPTGGTVTIPTGAILSQTTRLATTSRLGLIALVPTALTAQQVQDIYDLTGAG